MEIVCGVTGDMKMLFDVAVRPKNITEPATEILGEIEEDGRVKAYNIAVKKFGRTDIILLRKDTPYLHVKKESDFDVTMFNIIRVIHLTVPTQNGVEAKTLCGVPIRGDIKAKEVYDAESIKEVNCVDCLHVEINRLNDMIKDLVN